jgi:hypothetical protein
MTNRTIIFGLLLTFARSASGQSTNDSLLVESYRNCIKQCIRLSATLDNMLDPKGARVVLNDAIIESLKRDFVTLGATLPSDPDPLIAGVISSFNAKLSRFIQKATRLVKTNTLNFRPVQDDVISDLVALQNDVDNFREYMVAVVQNRFFELAKKELNYIHLRQDRDSILQHAIQDSVDSVLKKLDRNQKSDTFIALGGKNPNPADLLLLNLGDSSQNQKIAPPSILVVDSARGNRKKWQINVIVTQATSNEGVKTTAKQDLRNILGVIGYNHSVYSIFYSRRIDSAATVPIWAGAEILIPTEGAYANQMGGFLLAGLQKSELVFQLGIGLLNTKVQSTNVAWMAGLNYFLTKVGVGLHYSPLTGTGASFNYRF